MSLTTGVAPPKRSSGALRQRRVPLDWPADRDFRILSIDGGGIKGIFPAAILSGLERRYLGGESVANYFDLIAGTSTGGILALGLGAGLTATQLCDLYTERGGEIFPPPRGGLLGRADRCLRNLRHVFRFRYDRQALAAILSQQLGEHRFGHSHNRLCIPSFEGHHSETYIFKTPHHPDFRNDGKELMTKVGVATAAAPTFYQPFEDNGHIFVDGGVWANNPVMIALVDILSCYDIPRERIQILTLGCGDAPYVVDRSRITRGGLLAWRDVIYAAMRLQSVNALGQAGLLIGADRLTRIDAPASAPRIELDDWVRARKELPALANSALERLGGSISEIFLSEPAAPYTPLHSS